MANRAAGPLKAHLDLAPPPTAATRLTPTQLLATLREALEPWTPGSPFHIFAYGSLMWNPNFVSDAHHIATVRGYHRSFRLWSRINRGTPENPGLVLTLECGGSCRGIVYRIAADRVQEEMQAIWKREMLFGSYRPRWLNCTVGSETIRTLAFTVNRECSGYAGRIPIEAMVDSIASAAGRYGPAHEYLFKTVETLRAHGVRDSRVEHLAHLVQARLGKGSE